MKLSLFYPVRPFFVNQHWGDNIPCVKNFGAPNQNIVNGGVTTCPFGYEKLYPKFGMRGHNGVDLKAGVQNVYSANEGTVIEMQTVPARGLGVGVLTPKQYDFGVYGVHYFKIRYWHLKSINVQIGQYVEVGNILGVSDNTGYSSGNHVHFEGQLIDLDAGGHPVVVDVGDSIKGTIDLEPYFTGVYADEFAETLTWLEKLRIALQAFYDVYHPSPPGMSTSGKGRSG